MPTDYTFTEQFAKVPIQLVKTIIDNSRLDILDKEITLHVPFGDVIVPWSFIDDHYNSNPLIFDLNQPNKIINLTNNGKGIVSIKSIQLEDMDQTTNHDEFNSIEYPGIINPGETIPIDIILDSTKFLNTSFIQIRYNFENNKQYIDQFITPYGGNIQYNPVTIVPSITAEFHSVAWNLLREDPLVVHQLENFIPDSANIFPNYDLLLTFRLRVKENKFGSHNTPYTITLSIPDEFFYNDPQANKSGIAFKVSSRNNDEPGSLDLFAQSLIINSNNINNDWILAFIHGNLGPNRNSFDAWFNMDVTNSDQIDEKYRLYFR